MEAHLLVLLTNAATAGLIALVAWATSRVVRRQALVHGLWLLALVKLVTPPLIPMPVLPAWRASWPGLAPEGPTLVSMEHPGSAQGRPETTTALPARPPVVRLQRTSAPLVFRRDTGAAHPQAERPVPFVTIPVDPQLVGGLALAAGGLAVASLAVLRLLRFRRLLRCAGPAPQALRARADELAARIGLQRAPLVRLVPARVPPMLWPSGGGPELLLPAGLMPCVTDDERDTLLAHELAHVRRRDHWVRFLELGATTLFWWYPITWWARASLRRAEERCCDEWVLRVLPGAGPAYANGLIKSLTFVAGAPGTLPAIASGSGPVRDLEARLKEILMTRPAPRLAFPLRLALAAAAALGLAVFPTQAQPRAAQATAPATAPAPDDEGPAPAVAPAPRPAPAVRATAPAIAPTPATAPRAPAPVAPVATAPALAAVQEAAPRPMAASESVQDPERRALEEKRRALEAQRARLQERRLELTRQQLELEARVEQDQLRAEAERLRKGGETERAALLEKQAEAAARRADIQRQQLELEAERMTVEAQLEAGLREKAERSLAVRTEQEAKRMEALSSEEQVRHVREATRELTRSLGEQIEEFRRALDHLGPRTAELEAEMRRLEKALLALQEEPKP